MSLSAGQITLLRNEEQRSILGLAILQPKTVLACQITDYTGTDMVTEFMFGNVTSGSYSNVIPGQIVFVGTVAGAHDVGIFRVRKAWTSDTAYIGEESEIAFEDDLYLTVIDAFDVRPKHLVVTADEVFMDVDIAYSDQHENFDPVPILGGQVVLDVSNYPAQVSFPEVANSWVFDSTISSYLMTASAGVVTNGTTSNPTLTVSSYPTNGYVRMKLTVTAANGKSFSGYSYVLVFDESHRPITNFVLDSCSAERESGDWAATVKLNDVDDIALLRRGGLAILFSKDYYNGTEGVVGLYSGRENIWLSGWIWEHTKTNDPEFEPSMFEIRSAAFWMNRMASFPVGVETTPENATAAAWTECAGLTVDKGLFHFLHYRTTATQVMDVYLTNDTRYSPACESAAGTLWSQVTDIAESQILARPTCSHNGKLVVKTPYNLIPSAERSSHSSLVMALTIQDYERQIEITQLAPRVSQVVLNGVVGDEYGNGTPLFSLAPGHAPGLLGEILSAPNLLLASQEQSNRLAGLIFAKNNNSYEDIPLSLTGNNRAFDIAPLLYGTITGLNEYTGTIIPISINYTYDHENGKNQVEVIFEGETDEFDAIYINGDIPDGEGGFVDIPGLIKLPPLDPLEPPDIPVIGFPPDIPVIVTTDCSSEFLNFFPLVWSKPQLNGIYSNKLIANAYFPCKIRSNPRTPTYIDFVAKVHGDAASHISVYGVLGGSRIVQATLSIGIGIYTFRANFNVLSDTQVDGFEIELDAGIGTIIESATPGSTVSSGSVAATTEAGVNVTTVAESVYCVDGSGGPWDNGPGPANFYTYKLDGSGLIGNHNGSFFLTLPSVGVYAEAISANYGRVYFIAPDTDINFKVADTAGLFGDNSGTLGYILRNATVVGRALDIYSSILNNVCAI